MSDEHRQDVKTDLDVAAALVGVLETDMPLYGITVIEVLQADGTQMRLRHVHGEPLPHMEQIVGLLEMTKMDLAIGWDDDDEDEDEG